MTNTFSLRVTKEQIDVLRARLRATRWPSYDSRDDWSLGTSSDGAKRLALSRLSSRLERRMQGDMAALVGKDVELPPGCPCWCEDCAGCQ